MSPRAVLALDLDQTLIFSARSAGLDPAVEPVVWVEDYRGAPLSLMTAAAHTLLGQLAAEHEVVACTTRTVLQYRRVRLPGPVRFAICANGGIVLRDGRRDPDWDREVGDLTSGSASVPAVLDHLQRTSGHPWVKTVTQAEDLFCYLVATDRTAIDPAWVSDLTGWAGAHGLVVSVQGRKVYVVPERLTKGAAARWLADRAGARLLAAGDSLLDLPLLLAADVAIRPPHGELADPAYARLLPSRIAVASTPGAGAAVEMLAALRLAASQPLPIRAGTSPPREPTIGIDRPRATLPSNLVPDPPSSSGDPR